MIQTLDEPKLYIGMTQIVIRTGQNYYIRLTRTEAMSEAIIRVLVQETGQVHQIDQRFANLTMVFRPDQDDKDQTENLFRVSNQCLNWKYLPVFHLLLQAHQFDAQQIKLNKHQDQKIDIQVHTLDPLSQQILGSLTEDFEKTHDMLRLAEYLGLDRVRQCIYHKLSQHFHPGLKTTSNVQFVETFQIGQIQVKDNSTKKAYYSIFKALNSKYVNRIKDKHINKL